MPTVTSISSPGLTSFAGLTRAPFTCTRPPRTASVAALRVLKKRAAQIHLSTRMQAGLAGALAGLIELELTKLDPANLAGEGLRQVAHEFDAPRVGVCREPPAHERLDLLSELVRGLVVGREHDECLDDVPAQLVRRGDCRGFPDRRVLETDGLDLERADAVTGGDDHVVGATLVPDVSVFILAGGVLRMEPFAAEHRLTLGRLIPVAEREVRIRPRAETDLTSLALGDRILVLVEDLDIPAGHRLSHPALPHLHERIVGDER